MGGISMCVAWSREPRWGHSLFISFVSRNPVWEIKEEGKKVLLDFWVMSWLVVMLSGPDAQWVPAVERGWPVVTLCKLFALVKEN